MTVYRIVFYSRRTGSISQKCGYPRREDAERQLRQNGFRDFNGIWNSRNWIARIKPC